jgi:hypothetical protein
MSSGVGNCEVGEGVRHAFGVYREVRDALAADADAASRDATTDPAPFRRRIAVLAFVGFVEGDTHSRKRLALACHDSGRVTFTPAQLALLRAEQYALSARGDACDRPVHLPLLADLRFSLHTMAAAFGLEYLPTAAGPGWTALLRTVSAAQRIRGPARADDLQVRGADLDALSDAAAWYERTAGALLRNAAAVCHRRPAPPPPRDPVVVPRDGPLVRLPPRRQHGRSV